jgi:hypothetical protein
MIPRNETLSLSVTDPTGRLDESREAFCTGQRKWTVILV